MIADDDEKNYILHEGKMYLRVSSVCRGNYSHIDPYMLQRKCDIGTEVHRCIESDIHHQEVIPNSISSAKYLCSYYKWRDRVQPIYLQSERRYFCDKLMITGQIDALVILPGTPDPVLIDFKTSAQEQRVSWIAQAHLYHYLLSEEGHSLSPRLMFIKLEKEGKFPRVYEYEYSSKTLHSLMSKAVTMQHKKKI